MTAFAAAMDTLFADPNLASDAVYRAGGADAGIVVRVIVRRPDRIGDFGDTHCQRNGDFRHSNLGDRRSCRRRQPRRRRHHVCHPGTPVRDYERLIWTIEARPL